MLVILHKVEDRSGSMLGFGYCDGWNNEAEDEISREESERCESVCSFLPMNKRVYRNVNSS